MSSRFFNGELAPLRLLTQFYASFHFEHRAVQGLGRAIMNSTKVTSFKNIGRTRCISTKSDGLV